MPMGNNIPSRINKGSCLRYLSTKNLSRIKKHRNNNRKGFEFILGFLMIKSFINILKNPKNVKFFNLEALYEGMG